jgi:polyphosphate kinase
MSEQQQTPQFSQISSASIPLIDRDLSWLQFNLRVLEEAEDTSNPLLERVKFLAISTSNLNEFFMVRVSALENSIAQTQRRNDEVEQSRLIRLRKEICVSVQRFAKRRRKVFVDLQVLLEQAGILLVTDIMAIKSLKIAKIIYENEILPLIPKAEFFASEMLTDLTNLETAVLYTDKLWMRLPMSLPTMFSKEAKVNGISIVYFFFLDHLLHAFLDPIGSKEIALLRITRSADDTIDLPTNDPDCIPDTVLHTISKRDRGRPVRLEVSGKLDATSLKLFKEKLNLVNTQIFIRKTSLYLQALWMIVSKTPQKPSEPANMRLKPLIGWVPRSFRQEGKIFERLDVKDLLLHHPYDSFDSYVAFIKAAARDPRVIKIEQTFYRTDTDSLVVAHLKEAAKTKEVHVFIEARARFDELNNIRLAEAFKKSGVKVTFASGKLKLHAKIALVTLKLDNEIRYYSHLSTGNYNAITSSQYTDLAIITSNQEIGSDARQFFDSIYSQETPKALRKFVIAPQFLARRLLTHIKEEIEAAKDGRFSRIFIKVNALVDPKIIESLYTASQAGVKIDLIVRGACSLIPEIPGISENIKVLSIVDKFLEHSRVYYFGSSKKLYLSSADCMPRNFFSRLEIAFPILDQRIFHFLETVIISTYLMDHAKARRLTSTGVWRRRYGYSKENAARAQVFFEKLSKTEYVGTPLE